MASTDPHADGYTHSAAREQVTWTTVLYVLIAFALNTMLQPAGTVCGGPPAIGFMLRSSPIICLVDTGYLLYRLVYYYFTSNRRKVAHARLLRLRYQSWDDGAEDEVDTLGKMQMNQPVRLLVFLLTLPQFIRLYAFSGLYWSKMIASMYLASFVIVEILVVRPRAWKLGAIDQPGGDNREKRIKSSGSLSLPYVSVALAVAFMSRFGASALRDALDEPHTALLKHLGLVTFGSWTLALVFCYVMCAIDRVSWRDILLPTVLLAPMLGIPWVYYTLGPRIAAAIDRPLLVQVVSAGLAIAWVTVGLTYASTVTSGIRHTAKDQPRVEKHRRYIEKVLAWYFMLLHLVTAIMYLRYSYDPTGTSKPKWSEYLG